jgi:hypothetical protein
MRRKIWEGDPSKRSSADATVGDTPADGTGRIATLQTPPPAGDTRKVLLRQAADRQRERNHQQNSERHLAETEMAAKASPPS